MRVVNSGVVCRTRTHMVDRMTGEEKVRRIRACFSKKQCVCVLYLQIGGTDRKLGTKKAFDNGHDDFGDIFLQYGVSSISVCGATAHLDVIENIYTSTHTHANTPHDPMYYINKKIAEVS